MPWRVMVPASFMKYFKNSKRFERVLENIKIIAVDKGKCKAELCVDESHTNPLGYLHGALSVTLVDCISTCALMSDEKMAVPNVSVDMHLTYLKGATIGDSILVDAKTVKAGKNLAFLEVLITNKNSGDVLVRGSHTKFLKR